MKKLTIFESSVIGFFVGVIASTYIAYINSTGAFLGKILSWVSLVPILNAFNFPADKLLLPSFLFVIVVYTIYGAIVGSIIKGSPKATIFIIILIILFPVAIYFDQKGRVSVVSETQETNIVAMPMATLKIPEQYFGEEAIGDLNDDGKDDVAFLIPRDDDKEGIIYYMAAALKSDRGHAGTNLIFLGYKIKPENLNIKNGIVIIEYIDLSDSKSTTTKQMYVQVKDGILKQVKSIVSDNKITATTTPD